MPRVTALKEDPPESLQRQELGSAVVRFAGDSGDGMQVIGSQFTQSTALCRNDLATFPDFPAEIRAPRGTTFGVSGIQVQFADHNIYTPGDVVNALVAMNPAAFKMNIADVEPGGARAHLCYCLGVFTNGRLFRETEFLQPFKPLTTQIHQRLT